jgi:hypothetical protein
MLWLLNGISTPDAATSSCGAMALGQRAAQQRARFERWGATCRATTAATWSARPARVDGWISRADVTRRAPDALAYFFRKKERPVAVFISLPAAGLGTARLRIWSQE